jgi:hypothetical protein
MGLRYALFSSIFKTECSRDDSAISSALCIRDPSYRAGLAESVILTRLPVQPWAHLALGMIISPTVTPQFSYFNFEYRRINFRNLF